MVKSNLFRTGVLSTEADIVVMSAFESSADFVVRTDMLPSNTSLNLVTLDENQNSVSQPLLVQSLKVQIQPSCGLHFFHAVCVVPLKGDSFADFVPLGLKIKASEGSNTFTPATLELVNKQSDEPVGCAITDIQHDFLTELTRVGIVGRTQLFWDQELLELPIEFYECERARYHDTATGIHSELAGFPSLDRCGCPKRKIIAKDWFGLCRPWKLHCTPGTTKLQFIKTSAHNRVHQSFGLFNDYFIDQREKHTTVLDNVIVGAALASKSN